MDLAQYWFSALVEGPGPEPDPSDPGSPIGQSLRFNNPTSLSAMSRATGDLSNFGTEFTFSLWIKRPGPQPSSQGIIFYIPTGDFPSLYCNGATDPTSIGFSIGGSSPSTTNVLRDPSAWYHLVWVASSEGTTLYVNGQVYLTTTATWTGGSKSGYPLGLGQESVISRCFNGYMAAVYFVDGQALDPTTFGRINANGVWVPVAPSGLTYGANGFHLDFSDPNDLGADRSGNANDFTPTGFDTVGNLTRSGNVYTETGVVFQQAFDNSNFVGAIPVAPPSEQNSTNFMTTIELPELVGSVTVDFGYTNTANSTSRFLVSADGSASSWSEYTYGSFVPFPISISSSTPFRYVRWVLDSGVWNWPSTAGISLPAASPDYDLMQDSPTQNYATINPLYPGASASNANLTTANATGKPTILGIAGDVGVDGASVAWDGTEAGWISTGAINFGQQPSGFDEFSTRTMPASTILNGREHFQAITTGPDQGVGAGELGGNWSTYFTVPGGFPVGNNSANNAFDGDILTTSASNNYNPGLTATFAPTTPLAFTQLEVYSTGANFTNNEISWDGNTVTGAINTWVQVTDQAGEISVANPLTITVINTTASACLGAIRINGDTILVDAGPLAVAQQTFPSGLWWIKDRVNNNENQLVDSVGGQSSTLTTPGLTSGQAYVPPAGESVAWCWNYDASDPEINGFSITRDSDNVGADPYIHDTGLSSVDFVIFNGGTTLNVFHKDIDGLLQLNNPDAVLPVAGGYGIQSDGTIKVDGSYVVTPLTCYAWSAVPGYSAFGSYEGNSTSTGDGPFVYTGFKPAFLLYKAISFGNWHIRDSARGLYNPIDQALFANLGNSESANNPGNDVDFLSNGFKITNGDGDQNASGTTYIYAAFAENPFNAPATAR